MIQQIQLPYRYDALAPYISEATLHFHYDKHHAGYVKNTNDLIMGTSHDKKSLVEIIRSSKKGKLFNNAAQSFNHDFYWQSLTIQKHQHSVDQDLLHAIHRDFSTLDDLTKTMVDIGTNHFASGWLWLVSNRRGKLSLMTTPNADTPITKKDASPLLCLDLWEHAYYLDYQNIRRNYLDNIVSNLLNWEFASLNYHNRTLG